MKEMGGWTADWIDDPNRNRELCVEISFGNEVVAWIFVSESGEVLFKLFRSETDKDLPVAWLLELLTSAGEELLASRERRS